ncbi:LysR family transcriptional regulator [Paroceanicella profunda]|uniref:LysR family transcriptional regulator n=1 Tax=Paroceanicella profunda TaxID=2579971 RepID=A0A5B8FWN2_9RHOB|nr:LysR family transcriptional regulator [Paroceanicella profunda]QDL91944.1 LysR family transcriptional regulator [Paroceanicella profunda]
MMLNHRELLVFLSVCRLGSIGAAAQAMGMTQPALSRSLKRLESRLRVQLFVRHSGGMEPTDFGRVLLRHSELMEFETNRVIEEIDLLNGAATGHVRVGIVPSVAPVMIPRAVARVQALSPDIHIRIVEGSGDQILAAVQRGEVDFAVVGMPGSAVDLVVQPLSFEEVNIVARAGHPLAGRSGLTLEDLAAFPWAMPERGNAIWYGYENYFRRAGLAPPLPVISSNSVHVLKAIVGGSDLLTMLTEVSIAVEVKAGMLVALALEGGAWRRELALVRRPTGTLLPAARLLMRAFQEG